MPDGGRRVVHAAEEARAEELAVPGTSEGKEHENPAPRKIGTVGLLKKPLVSVFFGHSSRKRMALAVATD